MADDKLTKLIDRLRLEQIRPSGYSKNIRNLSGLIDSLNELHIMIGHTQLKQSIADQTAYVIKMMNHGMIANVMLNTVIYGPPGVGKTSIGRILAKIWNNLGYLKSTPTTLISDSKAKKLVDDQLSIIFIVIGVAYYIYLVMIGNDKKVPISKRLGIFISIALIILGLIYMFKTSSSITYTSVSKSENDIVIVSRPDFIGQYMGFTEKNTMNILEKSRGKVLFIDEAYTLVTDDRDSYGKEALDIINRYLSEHPNELVVIMAGYREQMDKLFTIQPGLERRFMWYFECSGYNGNELFDILQLHLKRHGWKIDDNDVEAVKKLINDNVNIFHNYGGDMEKLSFFSQLSNANNTHDGLILTIDDFKKGLIKFKQNMQI